MLLKVEGINKAFGGVLAARDVSFTVAAGQMMAIIGPNGAGKSTTFNILGGQLRPDSGDIKFLGESIAGLPPRDIWRRGVGRTFQVAQTFISMSVIENVQMALLSHNQNTREMWSAAATNYAAHALSLIEMVGLGDRAPDAVSSLAYGDVKRLELAMALANEPRLLLMDEPTAGMAPKERRQLMALTAELVRSRNMGLLFTEHDMDAVFGHADQILVLVRGEIIARGTPADIRANETVKRVYLGDMGLQASTQVKKMAGESDPAVVRS